MAERLRLLVNGEAFEGFEQATVTQSFGSSLAPSTFSLGYAPRVSADVDRVIIEAGDAVALRVGDEGADEGLIAGYVDDDDLSYSGGQTGWQASGRSRVGDLVDCSAVHSSRVFHDQTVAQIARALLVDYDVEVRDDAASDDAAPIPRHAIQSGETIADCIARAARLRGLALADAGGALVITRTGQRRTSTVLERGRNVLSGHRRRSWRNRYSAYRFRGQTRATDDVYGLTAAQLGHEIEDHEVTRTRRLVVDAQAHSVGDLGQRAVLERNVRAGQSATLSYEVSGWRTDEGDLWRPNTRVRVVDPWFEVEAELLVQRVTHTFGTSTARYRTQLDLVRPETYAEIDFPARIRGQAWR